MQTVKEISKYVKLLSAAQQEVLLEQLRLSQLMKEAVKIDATTANHQKKNKLKPLSIKEIVAVVKSVRADRRRKHAA